MPVAEACDYIRQAAMGLQHAHERGMVHRDIKPHNMMVTQDRVVKILDFGLASLAPQATPSEPISEDADGNLTIAGAIMGTPDFISPEQARDARQVDGRSDIYSLGMTLYYLLAGRAPFGEGSAIEKLKKQAEAEPEPLSRFREDIPAELENIIHRMTAKNPAERFQSPQEVAVALKPFANELTTVSKPQPAPQKTQAAGGSIVRWIGAAILIAMLGAGGLLLLNPSDPEADYKSLDKFLATGVSDEPAGDIVRRLLRKEEGRQFLRKLDARHPTLAYTEGQFARGYTSVAAFAYENHITGVAQPELLVIGWGPTVSGMKTCNVVESFTLEAIDFDNAPDNTCLATLQFRTPQNEKRALGLKAQSLYEAEIPIQTLIEGSLSLSNEFKKGKFVRNAPKDSSDPTDPQIVSDSNSNHQTDMPGGPGEQGFDSVMQGDWETVAVTEGGKQLATEDGFGGFLLQIKDDSFVIAEKKPDGEKSEVDTGQIEINSTATPKTIDFIGRAERRFGIYEFKQGMLRVCLIEQAGGEGPRGERFPDGNPVKRPTTFESPAGSNMILMEFQRKQPDANTEQQTRNLLDTTYISNDTVGLLVAHPQRILSAKSKVQEELDRMFAKVAESERLDVRNLRQIVVQLGPPPLSSSPIKNLFDEQLWTVILRFDEPLDVEAYIDKYAQGYKKAKHKHSTYYKHDSRMEMWFPDNRTLILAAERRILNLIDDPQGKGPMALRMRRADAMADLLLEIDVRQGGPLLLESLPSEMQEPELRPLVEQTLQKIKHITLSAKQNSDTPIQARFHTVDAEKANELLAQAVVWLETAKTEWPKLRDLIRERPANKETTPPNRRALALAFANEIDSVLPALRSNVDEDQLLVRLEQEGGVDLATLLAFFLLID